MLATQVSFDERLSSGTVFLDVIGKNTGLFVTSFTGGVAHVEPMIGITFYDFALIISGCFQPDSNFTQVLQEVYGCQDELTSIEIKFNTVHLTVTLTSAQPDQIITLWREACRAEHEEGVRRWEAYKKTPEYARQRKQELRDLYREQVIRAKIAALPDFSFKDAAAEEEYLRIAAKNSRDDYGRGILSFLNSWAKLMEHLIETRHCCLSQIADSCSRVCDDGLSGCSYAIAVTTLSNFWKYGDQLRRWHNGGYGYEGEGVVNPAVIHIGQAS